MIRTIREHFSCSFLS